MKYLVVPKIEQWQHYRDRCPPWIKLHQQVLSDYEFSMLNDSAKFHLIAIWLLASRTGNRIPNDPSWVQTQIQSSEKVDLKLFLRLGFLEHEGSGEINSKIIMDASNILADRKQVATSSVERGEESRGYKKGERDQNSKKNISSLKELINKTGIINRA